MMRFLFCLVLGFATSAFAQLKWEGTEQFVAVSPGEGKAVAHFAFTNAGNYPVRILGTETMCGCTAAIAEQRLYGPGEKGEVTVSFKTTNRKGLLGEPIVVKTNDPQAKIIPLKLRVLVRDVIDLQPPAVTWINGEPLAAKRIHIIVTDGFDVRGLNVTASDANVSINVETVKPGHEYNVLVEPKAQRLKATLNITPDYSTSNGNAPKTFVAHVRVS